MKAATPQPSPPVLELDGQRWVRATPADAPSLDMLAAAGCNRDLFGLPAARDGFVAAFGRGGFRTPMVCLAKDAPVGAAAGMNRNERSLNMRVLCWFLSPVQSVHALAMYVRHLYWLSPIHRLYVQFPVIEGAHEYRQLLEAVGFRDEGVLGDYLLIDGRPVGVAAFGILRPEFEMWCQQNEKRLTL